MSEMNEEMQKAMVSIQTMQNLKDAGLWNRRTAKFLIAARNSKNFPVEMGKIEQLIGLSKNGESIFAEPDETADAPIRLAVGENGKPIGIFENECHCLIAGMTGMGKSTLLKLMLSQAITSNTKVWVFVRSEEMRMLLNFERETLVVKFDDKIKINILNPGNLSPSVYANVFADIFIQSNRLYDGTKSYLLEHLNALYQKFEAHQKQPCIHDLYDYIKGLKHARFSRESGYRDSLLNRLAPLVYGSLGSVLECSKGIEESILNHNCIFEIDSLSREQQILLTNILLTKLFYSRLDRQPDCWHFVAFDDGNILFDKSFEKRPDQGLPIIHDLLSTVRKAMINIICCTQAPHQIGASIHSNSSNKIMFNLVNGEDLSYMFKSIGNLTKEQKQACYSLQPRQIVIKNSFRIMNPVLGNIPFFPEIPLAPQHIIDQNNAEILATLPQVDPRYQPEYTQSDNQSEDKAKDVDSDSQTPEKDKQENTVPDDTKTFLMTVNLNQYKKTLTETYKLAGLSAGKGTKISKWCEKMNLVKMIQANSFRGKPKYPVLLPDAYKILGIEEKKFYSKGAGFEHTLYQYLIAEHFKAFKPTVELNQNNKFIDVAIKTNESLIAFEVAMTSKHEKINLEKDVYHAKANAVVVVCQNKAVMKQVEKIISELSADIRTKAHVYLIAELLKTKPTKFIETLLTGEQLSF